MKRFLALLIVTVMLLSFTACGNNEEKVITTCWNCGETISDTAAYCAKCGSAVADNPNSTESSTTESTNAATDETEGSTESTTATDTTNTTETQNPSETQKPTETQKPAHTHSYSKKVTTATCIQQGYTTYTCSCGDTYTADQTAAKGHSYSKSTTPATCTQQGYTTYTCSCGDAYTADQTAAKGHSYNKNTTPATCTQQGYTTYTCSCGDTYKDNYTNPAHNYSNYKCTKCGAIDKANAYGYLMSWVKENGTTSGGYTRFKYNSGANTYMLVYSAQYNSLSVDKASVLNGGDCYMSLSLDSYFYGCTVLDNDDSDLEMCGYINAGTFTPNSAISYTVYHGDANSKSLMMELSRIGTCDLIEWLDWCLKAYDLGITIKDLGFKSY